MRSALVVSMCCILLSACTTIKLNDDNTNTITHKAGEGVAQDLAARACHRAGERRAVIISTMNKDPSKPEGTGRQVTIFRCTSQEPQTPSQ
jgi:hypothetical protein